MKLNDSIIIFVLFLSINKIINMKNINSSKFLNRNRKFIKNNNIDKILKLKEKEKKVYIKPLQFLTFPKMVRHLDKENNQQIFQEKIHYQIKNPIDLLSDNLFTQNNQYYSYDYPNFDNNNVDLNTGFSLPFNDFNFINNYNSANLNDKDNFNNSQINEKNIIKEKNINNNYYYYNGKNIENENKYKEILLNENKNDDIKNNINNDNINYDKNFNLKIHNIRIKEKIFKEKNKEILLDEKNNHISTDIKFPINVKKM